MNMYNLDIRQEIEKKRIKYFELAKVLGVDPCTLSRWLQRDLSKEKKAKILQAIKDFKY